MAEASEHMDKRSDLGRRICEAALGGTDNDWQFVDDNIANISEADIAWFEHVGLWDKEHAGIRDLSATALEGRAISPRTKNRLIFMVSNEPDPAARFRAAVALKHPVLNHHAAAVEAVIDDALERGDEMMRQKAREVRDRDAALREKARQIAG